MYASAATIRRSVAIVIKPPLRQTVAESAALWLRVSGSGGSVAPWSADLTPYCVAPMESLTDRTKEAVCFVGPSRTGKTMIIDAWLCHQVLADPGDAMVIHMTQDTARDYSRLRIDRMIRHSPELKEAMSPHPREDNTHDKWTRAGQVIKIAWPTITQLSGKEFRYAALTDYDRFPEDVGGEGDAFGLAMKRLQTYLSAGMAYVESSPGYECTVGNWTPSTAHEAPPVDGILAIYNRSDRRRWYWKCVDCYEWFEAVPGLGLFALPEWEELIETVKRADLTAMARRFSQVACPHCGCLIEHKHKKTLNRAGRWLIDGQTISKDGVISGVAQESTIAGFLLGGVAAAYQSWQSIVSNYLHAVREWTTTAAEESLKRTITQDQGAVYIPIASRKARHGSHELQARAEYWQHYHVPDGVRFLVVGVDVQHNRFVVQVQGYGTNRERWLIDRFNLARSERKGQTERQLPVNPGAYPEDWDLLFPLIEKSYPLADESGRRMRVHSVGCDSGGVEGVTANAYAFWRRCRKKGLARPGRFSRFFLLKGEHKAGAPRIEERYPDARGRKARKTGGIGDVPLWFLGVNAIKDTLAQDVARNEPGAGYYHFPSWIEPWWYEEFTQEQRTQKGWIGLKRNEAWDLATYCDALATLAGIDHINWNNPPAYAQTWDKNSLVFSPDQPKIDSVPVQNSVKSNSFIHIPEGKKWIR